MTSKAQTMDQNAEGKPKKKGRKLLLVLILIVLVGLGGGAALAIYTENEMVAGLLGTKKKEVELMNLPLQEFIVNLSDANYRRYLKISLVVEYEDAKVGKEVEKNNYIVRDAIINLLSSKSVTEISNIDGKEKLKSELLTEVNKHLKQGKVQSLFWTDFVIQ